MADIIFNVIIIINMGKFSRSIIIIYMIACIQMPVSCRRSITYIPDKAIKFILELLPFFFFFFFPFIQ